MAHVTFIHGIDNKPAEDALTNAWLRALRWETIADTGLDLDAAGVTSSMVYWADVLYSEPLPETAYESLEAEGLFAATMPGHTLDVAWLEAAPPDERRWVQSLAKQLAADEDSVPEQAASAGDVRELWAPWFIKRPLMEALVRDTHHYLFDVEYSPRPGFTYHVQDEIRNRTLKKLTEATHQSAPHIVVTHSMGTVIAYDCLKRVPDCPGVDGLITLGSPLGLSEVEEKLEPEWSRLDGYPKLKLKGAWHNLSDRLDVVAAACPKLALEYQLGGAALIEDHSVSNDGAWRHDMRKYLKQKSLRDTLRSMLKL